MRLAPVQGLAILFGGSMVKVKIMCKDYEFEPQTRFRRVVEMIRERMKDEPMIRTIREKTGQDHIVFILNGKIIREPEYDTTVLAENDDVRWVHPYFGG